MLSDDNGLLCCLILDGAFQVRAELRPKSQKCRMNPFVCQFRLPLSVPWCGSGLVWLLLGTFLDMSLCLRWTRWHVGQRPVGRWPGASKCASAVPHSLSTASGRYCCLTASRILGTRRWSSTMISRVAFVLIMAPSVLHGGFFMQLFADSGLQISCPSGMSVPSHSNSFRSEEPYMILHYSGNPVYIHPILADLQQCEQQLGAYNKSTCPGGTACERFPILVPEFQVNPLALRSLFKRRAYTSLLLFGSHTSATPN